MTSLTVIKTLIIELGLEEFEFQLICHPAMINWRQFHSVAHQKLSNIDTAIQFDKPQLQTIRGRELFTFDLNSITGPETPLVSLSSLIRDQHGRFFHLPMMNLHLDQLTTVNELRKALDKLSLKDYYLVSTDRYFHVYGSWLMTQEEWRIWNLQYLMTDALVSPRYIGHSLERGFNLLRLNATHTIKTKVPKLLDTTDYDSDGLELLRKFAAMKHGTQLTRAGEPYINHLLEVERYAKSIAEQLKLSESTVRIIRKAAILHDTIEDTDTDHEDIERETSSRVADMVSLLSNDKRLSKSERDRQFLHQIKEATLEVQIIKLADIFSNLLSIERQSKNDPSINVNYFTKAKRFIEILDEPLKSTSVFERCSIVLNKMSVYE